MNYTRLEAPSQATVYRPAATRLASLVAWAVVNAALLFAEQLAELLAPILLLAGAVWWAIPAGLDALRLDGPAADMVQQVRAHVPLTVAAGGEVFSAYTLVLYGLLCVGVVAICRTLATLLARVLLDRP